MAAGEESLPKRAGAAARRFNRDPRLVALVRGRRHRALGIEPAGEPGDDAAGRTVASSAEGAAERAMLELAELRGGRHGVLGELGMAALQAWQRLAESAARGRGDADVTILFTDLVGFSAWALEAGDREAVRLLSEMTDATEAAIRGRRGEVVKYLGDGVMAAFGSGPDAFAAALECNRRVEAIATAGYEPRLRSGIHLGRPRKLGGDYFGVDVNIAARLVEAAKPGEILASGPVLATLRPAEVEAKRRRFKAKGAPPDLGVYALSAPAAR